MRSVHSVWWLCFLVGTCIFAFVSLEQYHSSWFWDIGIICKSRVWYCLQRYWVMPQRWFLAGSLIIYHLWCSLSLESKCYEKVCLLNLNLIRLLLLWYSTVNLLKSWFADYVWYVYMWIYSVGYKMTADEGKEEYEEVQAELRKKDEEVTTLYLTLF